MKRLSLPNYISRSGAGFEAPDVFLKSSKVVDTNADTLDYVGIPIAQIDKDTYATTKEELHCFVIGESGCGKTRRVIMPTIRLMAKTGESMVISDPKGELYKYTADSLKKRGYDVKVLNFRNPRNGNRWNPLHLVETLYRNGSFEEKDKAVMLLDDLISIISSSVEDKEDQYWSVSASGFFRGTAQIIMEYGNPGDLTFENIALAARSIHKAYSSSRLAQSSGDDIKIKSIIDAQPKNSPIVQNLSSITNNASDTRNSIVSVFEGMISDYCNQELLLDLFSKSEIDIASIGKKPTALFFILPDDSDAMYPVATYFVKQVYSTLISLADEQMDGILPNKVTFLLDEFANFAKLPTMHAMLTAARSRGIRFVLVCQSMDQLIDKYGEPGMEILLSNCRVWLYMSCRNLPFLQRLINLAGQYTSPYTGEQFPLISIDTLQHFQMGQVLIFNDRCRPLLGYLDDYSSYDFGEEGTGSQTQIPQAHEVISRRLFSIDDAVMKLRKRQMLEGQIPELVARVTKNPNDIVAKSSLAHLIRYYGTDICDVDFNVSELLEQGCLENDPPSLMDKALQYIEQNDFQSAFSTIRQIPPSGYPLLISCWYNKHWKEESSPEGAFVSYLCYIHNAIKNPLEEHQIWVVYKDAWMDKLKGHRLMEFLNDDKVALWIEAVKESADQDESDE